MIKKARTENSNANPLLVSYTEKKKQPFYMIRKSKREIWRSSETNRLRKILAKEDTGPRFIEKNYDRRNT